MKKLRNLCVTFLALSIASVSNVCIPSPAKADLLFDVRYKCITKDYLVETNGSQSGRLTYTAYEGSYNREDSPSREPDLVLYNGSAYFQKRNKLLMTWRKSGGYIYQLSVSGSRSEGGIGYPQSGTLIVKRRGRITLQQKCRYVGSMEVTEP